MKQNLLKSSYYHNFRIAYYFGCAYLAVEKFTRN